LSQPSILLTSPVFPQFYPRLTDTENRKELEKENKSLRYRDFLMGLREGNPPVPPNLQISRHSPTTHDIAPILYLTNYTKLTLAKYELPDTYTSRSTRSVPAAYSVQNVIGASYSYTKHLQGCLCRNPRQGNGFKLEIDFDTENVRLELLVVSYVEEQLPPGGHSLTTHARPVHQSSGPEGRMAVSKKEI